MPAPAVNITTAASPVPRSSPTDTGVAHVVGVSTTGPARLLTEDDACVSLQDWLDKYGGGTLANGRATYSVDYDWVDTFFREGGSRLYYSRVVGPTPVYATLNLAGTGTTLVVTANEYGSHFNQFKISVINGPVGGSGYRVVRLLANDGTTVIDQTAEFNDRTAVNGVTLGGIVTITLGGGSGLPTVASATSLASGTDDHANITQTQVDTALTRLNPELGPGQVCAPNWQTSACHTSLIAHAAQYGRFALCDPTDTTVKSTLLTFGTTTQGDTNSDYGALYAPWITVPALSGGSTGRSVPPSALVAGKIAQTDAAVSTSQAPAGQWGRAQYATNVNASFSRLPQGSSDADDLSEAGVNLIVVKNGTVTVFDNLTLAAQTSEFSQIGVSRWRMRTVAEVLADADNEMFARINLNTLTAWKSKTDARLLRQYLNGDLFGDLDDDRPETAFNTDVDTPNTPASINDGEMNMNIAARPVKGGRILNISITAVPITGAVA